MSNNKINYNNEVYTILKNIIIENTEFAICINEYNNKIIYLKVNYIGERATYVSFKNIIKVLPDYQNITSSNKEIILENFIEEINIILNEMKFYNPNSLIETIDTFEEYLKDNEIYYYTKKNMNMDVPTNMLNKMRRHLRNVNETYNEISNEKNSFKKVFKKISLIISNILNNKFCGAYTIMVIVSAVGIMICFNEYMEWKESGKDTATIMDDILSSTNISYTEEENRKLNEILDNQSNPNDVPVTDSEANSKYGTDYWTYKRVSMMSVDFSQLINTNIDTVGWIFVNNTNINYPFVQTTNNEYYLNHSFDGSQNIAGWLFADYRADFENFKRNNVIYGHGRTDQVMFGSLEKTLTPEWYTNEANQYIKMSTPTKNLVWKVVSIYTIPAEAYYLTHNFDSDESFRAFINTILGRSIYNFNTDVNTNDKLLTLSTCLNYYGDRIVVHAKLVREEKR